KLRQKRADLFGRRQRIEHRLEGVDVVAPEIPWVEARALRVHLRVRELLEELHGEQEARWGSARPAQRGLWRLDAVEGRVDLDGVEPLSVGREFVEAAAAARAGCGIEQALPGAFARWVAPSRRADANHRCPAYVRPFRAS